MPDCAVNLINAHTHLFIDDATADHCTKSSSHTKRKERGKCQSEGGDRKQLSRALVVSVKLHTTISIVVVQLQQWQAFISGWGEPEMHKIFL